MNTNENQTTSRKALLMDSFKIIRKASNASGNPFSRVGSLTVDFLTVMPLVSPMKYFN